MARDVVVLWAEDGLRCELHTGVPGEAQLVVIRAGAVIVAESVRLGAAHARAEVLQLILRGIPASSD